MARSSVSLPSDAQTAMARPALSTCDGTLATPSLTSTTMARCDSAAAKCACVAPATSIRTLLPVSHCHRSPPMTLIKADHPTLVPLGDAP